MSLAVSIPAPRFDAAALRALLRIAGNPGPPIRAGISQVPPPSFDAEALLATLARIDDPVRTIRNGLAVGAPEWREGADALTALFGLTPDHCFHVAPHRWTKFHEPQITGGFAHFLNSGTPRRRLARAVAFVKAAAACAGQDASLIDVFDAAAARCVAEENRTDILVELRHGDERIGASVEAKFGHRLTSGQLPKALKHARDTCGLKIARSVLLVVAPDEAQLDRRVLRQNRRSGWRATSWSMLLLHLERLTAPEHDCREYRRFRRTVWHRAY